MAKRSWADANVAYGDQGLTPTAQIHLPQQISGQGNPQINGLIGGGDAAVEAHNGPHLTSITVESFPKIGRKSKACAACRRHKIKCVLEEGGPPCRRCAKHDLDCVLTRPLQTIIDEGTRHNEAIFRDLENLHAALRELTRNAGLPGPNALHTRVFRMSEGIIPTISNIPSSIQLDDDVEESGRRSTTATGHGYGGLSRDASPEQAPVNANLSQVPIHSLYELTKLSALRSPDNIPGDHRSCTTDDFIARGVVRLDDAERLYTLYRERLDGFMFAVGCPYRSLQEIRKNSPVLTAAILTVAALHDPESDQTYKICSSEFRHLIERSMFNRSVNLDYLRALCVASYWLSDMSWMLSGYAIRRAFQYELHEQLQRVINDQSNEEAADGTRLWFILHISDQRLAILYGRPAIVLEHPSIEEIERYLETPASNLQDRRLMSQVALSSIFKSIRELFGPDRKQPIPKAYLHQITYFNKQIDQWLNHWSSIIAETYDSIGCFPRKAAQLHFYFAKLHLFSHAFRGLSGSDYIPHYLLDCATAAISAAISNIDMILTDPVVSSFVVGMPSYLHCMTAFACMFLIKVAHKYGKDLIDLDRVWNLTTRLVRHFRSVPASRWHLTKLMTHRLERIAAVLDPEARAGGLTNLTYASVEAAADMNVYSTQHHLSVSEPGSMANEPPLAHFPNDQFFDNSLDFGLTPMFPFESIDNMPF